MNTASELLRESAGGDLAAESPAAPGDNGTTASASTGAIPKENPCWTDAVEDGELREFARNKGWKQPAEMVQGYRNLEKLIGGEKVPLPKGEADTEGWERVYKALGRPATPEEYQLADADSAAQYHKLGLTARQASGLNTWQTEQQTAKQAAAAEEHARQLAAVRKEWGQDFESNVRLGKRAVRELGLEGSVEALETALGSGELLRLTAKLGRGLAEDRFAGQSGAGRFGMSQEEAQEELGRLQRDKGFVKRYLEGDSDSVRRFTQLHAVAYPGQ